MRNYCKNTSILEKLLLKTSKALLKNYRNFWVTMVQPCVHVYSCFSGLEKLPVSRIFNSVTHLWSFTNSTITVESPILPETLRRVQILPYQLPDIAVPSTDIAVLLCVQVFHDVSESFMSVSWWRRCFTSGSPGLKKVLISQGLVTVTHLRSLTYFCGERPSVTVRRILEFVHFRMNLHDISNKCNLNKISCAPCEYGASTYSR